MKNHGFLGSLIYTATLLASCANNELADKSVVQKKAEIYYGQGTNDLVKKNYSQALINLLKARTSESNRNSLKKN